ncbi:ThuA domain-containing protein [Fontivita pretiosa]|uniref:ThuA domain-containing protein n=1 Tax=Fontivita pretiosa TaxID=2989684 RepID=UPI003D172874
MRKALIVWGGWDGHQPEQVAQIFRRVLTEENFQVEVRDTLDAFLDAEKLMGLSLIVPVWTMGKISNEQARPVFEAVKSGVGIAGCHGGMCDAFRENTEWQFMTGGQWVAHPGNDGTRYTVKIGPTPSPITQGIRDFEVCSEQYYMHVDPAVKVLATTRFPVADGPHAANGPVDMPVVWTKLYGKGRVFYDSLGHHADIVESEPNLTIMRRGFLWAAR